jgi:Flp pilus assembly protein TadD
MRRLTILPIALLLLASSFAPALAQDWSGRGRLNGQVVDENKQPIEGARVFLLLDGKGPDPIVTNQKGRWSYLGLTGGSWTVRIEADGLVPREGPAQVSEFGSGKALVTTLRPIPEEVLAKAAATEAMKHLETGNQLLSEGKPVEARVEYEAALIDLEPENHPPVLVGIASTHYAEDSLQAAEETLLQVLEIEPDNVAALKLLSSMLISQGREEEAKVLMERLPEGEVLDADAYLNVGIDAYNDGRLDEALTEFNEVVQQFPDLPEAYYYRGLVLLNQGNNDGAIADFEKLLELAPDHPKAAEATSFLEYLNPSG